MPTTPASAHTLRATAASSPAYARLWKGLTTHAVQPALAHQVDQSKASGAVASRRKQRGGRKSASASSAGRNAGFGQKEFVADWTQSIHELIEANRKHAARKQGKRSSKQGAARSSAGGRRSTKQLGGFIRDGSVQYFPADSGCRAQMAGHSN